jgi:hypothetical protein
MMDRSLCSVVAFHLYFIVLYISRTSFSNKLECSTDQLDDIVSVTFYWLLFISVSSESFFNFIFHHSSITIFYFLGSIFDTLFFHDNMDIGSGC